MQPVIGFHVSAHHSILVGIGFYPFRFSLLISTVTLWQSSKQGISPPSECDISHSLRHLLVHSRQSDIFCSRSLNTAGVFSAVQNGFLMVSFLPGPSSMKKALGVACYILCHVVAVTAYQSLVFKFLERKTRRIHIIDNFRTCFFKRHFLFHCIPLSIWRDGESNPRSPVCFADYPPAIAAYMLLLASTSVCPGCYTGAVLHTVK